MSSTRTDPGHVFVIKGDKQHLACDVYLQSTDRDLRPGGGWLKAIPDAAGRLDPQERADFHAESRFAIPVRVSDPRSTEATPVLVAVPYYGTTDADQLRERVQAYFEVAHDVIAERGQVTAGVRPLVAVPLFAHRAGGGGMVVGDILRVLYDEARDAVARYGYDAVLVLMDARAYDLAQTIRRRHDGAWSGLSPEELGSARQLGADAARGRLVPFMGSGISVSAGAPTWRDLIERLAASAGLSDDTAQALAGPAHDVLDQAAYLRRAFAGRGRDGDRAFAEAVIEAVDMPRYGLAPALLASLTAEQAITLNYDRLFECAAEDAGLPRRVIPGEVSEHERWLLKLHGTVTDPASIVLTRADYLGFDADKGALSSLVKATLVTRRLLFVGFGMSDGHFHEIVHDVRRALPASAHHFGTVLTLHDDEVTRTLWKGDLDFITFPDDPRRLEVFLDAVLGHAAETHSYLLAHDYRSTLSGADAKLAGALVELIATLDEEAKSATAWPLLEAAFRELGWRGRGGRGAGRPNSSPDRRRT